MHSIERSPLRVHVHFDPFDPAFLHDPYPVYDALRAQSPVYVPPRVKGGALQPAWIFAHSLASGLLASPQIQRQPLADEDGRSRPDGAKRGYAQMLGNWMLFQDAPSHTRQRASLGRIFTPRVVGAMRTDIERMVERRIDTLFARGSADLIRDFAYPLPVQVIASLLGLPVRHCVQFKRWSTALSDAIDLRPGQGALQAAEDAVIEMGAYFTRFAAARRRNPRPDLLTTLVAQINPDEGLTEDEAFATFTLLITAGHETTTNLIGNGMLALLSNPDQLQVLREEPAKIRTAVEEFLRFDSPVQITSRIASRTQMVAGHELEGGQRVLIVIGAANRDPSAFADPGRLDISRAPNPHLTFGAGGHYCAGAPLARLQAAIAINALVTRLPNLRPVADRRAWRANASFRGMLRFPCRA